MKIFIDTNVLISAILNPDGITNIAYNKATIYPNIGIICDQNIDELNRIFIKKFPDKIPILNTFLRLAQLTIVKVPIPREPYIKEAKLRDIKDRPILRAAIYSNADIILTGDKDFLESGISTPKMVNPSDFINNYFYNI